MTMLVENPWLEEQLKEQRRAAGIDQHDEVWEGVYFMAPLADIDHQDFVAGLTEVFRQVVNAAGLGRAFPGVNLAGAAEDWRYDFRAPTWS